MSDAVDGQTTAENYEKWHRALESRHPFESFEPRPGVLISELFGPDDGPHPDRWEEREES
jgi:hypothetical protein